MFLGQFGILMPNSFDLIRRHLNMQKELEKQRDELFRKYLENVSDEFVQITGGTYVHIKTGEMFTEAEYKKYTQKKIEQFYSEFLESSKRISVKEVGTISDQQLFNKRSKDKTKLKGKIRYDCDKGAGFNIVYRDTIEGVRNMKLTTTEKLVYYVLRDFINYPTNCILINDKVPTFLELEKIVGLKERTIREMVKSLETKGLFKLKQHGHRKAIYVNPTYYASGKELDPEVLQMYNLIECDDEKVDSYLN
jgi:hypothetical protein